jgi:hypothetical protein
MMGVVMMMVTQFVATVRPEKFWLFYLAGGSFRTITRPTLLIPRSTVIGTFAKARVGWLLLPRTGSSRLYAYSS